MPELLRDTPFDFACRGCGHQFHETLGWLQANANVICPGCGETINLKFDERDVLGGLFDALDRLK